MEKSYGGWEELGVSEESQKRRQAMDALTKKLPSEEKYILLPQKRRAAPSVTNNIANGLGRYHPHENARFLRPACGSPEEVPGDLTGREDVGLASRDSIAQLSGRLTRVEPLLNGGIRDEKTVTVVRESPSNDRPELQSPGTRHHLPIPDRPSPP